jgi:3-methyladenine DNA glycosylase AlkD
MTLKTIIQHLRAAGKPENVAGMARYGIVSVKAFGVPMPLIRSLAKEIGTDHKLAQRLWAAGIYDARLLAVFVDDPSLVTRKQMKLWARDFDNWAICDGCCIHLFRKTKYAFINAVMWSAQEQEFVKRAGFTLMATLAVHEKDVSDTVFTDFLTLVRRESRDDRNGVKKAVNWALRQIGKRNCSLNKTAITIAREIRTIDSPAARWIAADALRELTSGDIQSRLRKINFNKSKVHR